MDSFSGRLLETRFCDTPEKTVQQAITCPQPRKTILNSTIERRTQRGKLIVINKYHADAGGIF
jgi:hypothetical protein